MSYTEDWFTGHTDKLLKFANSYCDKKSKLLEIGSFEGRSANWFVENFCCHPESQITCIDPFTGSREHNQAQKLNLYDRFIENTKKNSGKIRILRESSEFALPKLLEAGEKFNFIYIDGNHTFDAVMCDAIYAHKLIEQDGIIVFDDYEWCVDSMPASQIPHHAVKAFLAIHAGEYEVLESKYQVTIRRI